MQAKAVYEYFIDEYVDKAPLIGQAFTTGVAEVYYIFRFTSGNTVAEAKMVAHAAVNNGRLDSMSLKDQYEGIGVHAVNAVQADKVFKYIYSGEKKPHTWWDEFEMQLTDALYTYDCLEKRSVYSNSMILRISNRNILADLLQAIKGSIIL